MPKPLSSKIDQFKKFWTDHIARQEHIEELADRNPENRIECVNTAIKHHYDERSRIRAALIERYHFNPVKGWLNANAPASLTDKQKDKLANGFACYCYCDLILTTVCRTLKPSPLDAPHYEDAYEALCAAVRAAPVAVAQLGLRNALEHDTEDRAFKQFRERQTALLAAGLMLIKPDLIHDEHLLSETLLNVVSKEPDGDIRRMAGSVRYESVKSEDMIGKLIAKSDRQSKRPRQIQVDLIDAADRITATAQSPEQEFQAKADAEVLYSRVKANLTRSQWKVFELLFALLPEETIAERTGYSLATVYKHISDGRKRLKERGINM